VIVCNRRYYVVQYCTVTYNATWRVLWTVDFDLPTLGIDEWPENYTVVDVRRTGPLLRQSTALYVYLDKVVSRKNISSLLDALQVSLTAMSSGMLLS